MKNLYTVVICILLSIHTASAQHGGHAHDGRNEIGVSTGAFYAIDDKEWGTGVHLHYFRTLGPHSRWAVGAFAEQAWMDENHFSFGIGGKFEVLEGLHVGAFPGLTFAKHNHEHSGHNHNDDKTKAKFSMHMEAVYDLIEWNSFHLGPVVDYSWSKDDSHFTLGVHMAYCF